VEGVLLRPLPFKDGDRLVLLGDHLGGRPGISVRAREIAIYSGATQAFSFLGGYITTSFELSGGAQPEEINAGRLNSAKLALLGCSLGVLGSLAASRLVGSFLFGSGRPIRSCIWQLS